MTSAGALTTAEIATTLPALIDRAINALAGARSAAEVLEARDLAAVAYDVAKRAGRLAKAKQAHEEVITAALRAQGDAMKIQSEAAHRLADEYDAAQERGEINTHGGDRKTEDFKFENAKLENLKPHDLHEARLIRDAEEANPGIVHRTVDEAVASGEEPTKAKVRRAALRVVKDGEPAPQPMRGKEVICVRVRDAIAALSGLPPAAEVVGYFAGTDSAIIIDEKLKQTAEWIAEFQAAWGSASDADQN